MPGKALNKFLMVFIEKSLDQLGLMLPCAAVACGDRALYGHSVSTMDGYKTFILT